MSGTTFYVGIDLGTSRTSIATSTGKRLTEVSCVGYAKDIITKKRFGKDYLLGEEALENRMGLNMVWPLGAGVLKEDEKSLEAASLILKHVVAKAIPDKKPEDKIFAAIGVPAEASNNSKKHILEIADGIFDKIMVVSEPFAVAYSLERFDETLIVDIGAGSADLLRVCGALPTPEDSITLETAGNFLDAQLEAGIKSINENIQLTPQIVKKIKEKHGYVSENSDPALVTLTVGGKPQDFDITEVLREACLKLTDPICEAVQQLIATFDPEFQHRLRNNIVVAGGGSRLKGIDRAIEYSLKEYGGGYAECVQDAEFQGALGCLSMASELPDEYWDEL